MRVRCTKPSSGVIYLTGGKTYKAYNVNEWSFHIRDDDGDEVYCLFEKCSHAEWEVLESYGE